MFKQLDAARIEETTTRLQRRIEERFPSSSLGRVAAELGEVARGAPVLAAWLSKPIWPLRIVVGAIVALLVGLVGATISFSHVALEDSAGFWESAQGIEAAINDVVFLGVAIYFLWGLERRRKRKRAQEALHVLRSLAHVVDMHQLTKDPERLGGAVLDTASSPERTMTAFELTRYLDYASELLALISKVGVLYVQGFDDAETLETASDVEELTIGLSRNIWQKILILDRVVGPASEAPVVVASPNVTLSSHGKGEEAGGNDPSNTDTSSLRDEVAAQE